jgi:hypothetical protein
MTTTKPYVSFFNEDAAENFLKTVDGPTVALVERTYTINYFASDKVLGHSFVAGDTFIAHTVIAKSPFID